MQGITRIKWNAPEFKLAIKIRTLINRIGIKTNNWIIGGLNFFL